MVKYCIFNYLLSQLSNFKADGGKTPKTNSTPLNGHDKCRFRRHNK